MFRISDYSRALARHISLKIYNDTDDVPFGTQHIFSVSYRQFSKNHQRSVRILVKIHQFCKVLFKNGKCGIQVSFDQDDYRLRIASAEKAVCDKIYTMHPVDNVIEMGELMFEDLRFDESMIEELDKNIIEQLVDGYHSKNVKLLSKVLEDY